ncbi:dTMP kinase [Balneatrix alpica]|uniref:dTMP kinase n=1 Tax=Balneatrix alpica TaxID=75684 RepID=UPI002739A9C5|nr:dTMP kinase [Balneatrix alpica]
MKGVFITLEGVEGAGKSSALATIQAWLDQQGLNYVLTREPGGTPLAEQIRELMLSPRQEKVADLTELLLVFAARAQHIETKIRPHLLAGEWVVSDRFTDASFAYQGGGRGLPLPLLEQLEFYVQGETRPDLTLLLDLPAEIGLARAQARGAQDRIEQEQISFFNRVRETYRARANAEPQRFRVIDASQTLAQVQVAISAALDSWYAQFRA